MKATVLLFIIISMASTAAFAGAAEVNLDDKLDSYTLMAGKRPIGKVTVQSTFVEEPVAMPIEITVKINCFRGYRLKNTKRTDTWQAFDYGHPAQSAQLSSFDAERQVLTVYYWTSKVSQEHGVRHGKSLTRRLNLAGTCAPE